MNMAYLVSDYYATGEGRTISIMITPTSREGEDRDRYLKDTFEGQFGEWFANGLEEFSKHDFESRYANFLPEIVYDILAADYPPAYIHWFGQIHYNFS